MSDSELRQYGIEYAIEILHIYQQRGTRPLVTPIELSDLIYQYIKKGTLKYHKTIWPV